MDTFIHDGDLPMKLTAKFLGVDTETSGLKLNRDKLRLVQINQDDKAIHIIRMNEVNPINLIYTLEDPSAIKIFHYARFDMGFLSKDLGIDWDESTIYCTKIMSKLIRTYAAHHGLAALYKEMTGLDMPKESATTNWGSKNLTNAQIEYAAKDVRHLINLYEWLHEMLMENPYRWKIAKEAFGFLPTRVDLDLEGFEDMDIFSH